MHNVENSEISASSDEIGRRQKIIGLLNRDALNQVHLMLSVLDLAATFGLLAASIASILWTPYFLLVHIVLVPLLTLRFWAIGHEASHGLVFKNRQLNDFFGLLSHGIILMPFYGWRAGHLSHHNHNDHPVKEEYFPASLARFFQARDRNNDAPNERYPGIGTAVFRIVRIAYKNFIYDIGLWRSHTAPRGLLLRSFKSPVRTWLNIGFPVVFWALYIVLTLLDPLLCLLAVWLPLFLGHGLIGIVGFLNHQDIESRVEFRYKSSKDVAAHQTIDVDYGPINWFAMGIGDEHTMHHLVPYVPWYRLRKARLLIEKETGQFDRLKAPSGAWPTLYRVLTSKPRLFRTHEGYKLVREEAPKAAAE